MNKPMSNWGVRARRERSSDMLSAKDELRLLRAWQERGDSRARDHLIHAFGPMAAAMAKRYSPGGGEADPDLVQQATIGLMKAADRFNPDMGNRFATYAVWWVRAEIQDYKRNTLSVVRRPNSAQSRMAAVQIARLDTAMATDPDIDPIEAERRIAKAIGLGRDKLADLRAQITGTDFSLNVPATGNDGDERLALLVDPDSLEDTSHVHRLDVAVLRRALIEALSTLPVRERSIVIATQLNDPPATLESLGDHYGISKERVRQLRERGFERLRETMRENDLTPESFV